MVGFKYSSSKKFRICKEEQNMKNMISRSDFQLIQKNPNEWSMLLLEL